MQMTDPAPEAELEAPPILGSWRRMYAAVLIGHVVFLTVLYLISQRYL